MKEISRFDSLFHCLIFFFSFFYSMHPISFVNKTIKNDHPIALYEFIIELSKKIPSCASLTWMNTNYWVYNFAYEIIIEEQRLSLDSSFSSSTLFQTRIAPNFLQSTWSIFCSKICLSVSILKEHSDYKRNIWFSWHSYLRISISF